MNLVATNGRPYTATEQSVLGSFAEAGRAGETKGTKAPGNLDDDETKSAEDSANWCQPTVEKGVSAGVCEPDEPVTSAWR